MTEWLLGEGVAGGEESRFLDFARNDKIFLVNDNFCE
jgi:hypothetical protein